MKFANFRRPTLRTWIGVYNVVTLSFILAMILMPLFSTPATPRYEMPCFEMIQDVADEPLPPASYGDVPMEIPPVITEGQDIEPLPPEVLFNIDSELVPEPVEIEIVDIDF